MIRRSAQKLAHVVLRLWLTAFHNLRAPRVKLSGPTLIVANHASHLDIAAIFAALPVSEIPNVRVAAARDHIYGLPGPLLAIVEFLFNTFPFERQGRSTNSLDACADHLRAGRHVVIFPEGRRSPDGQFLGFTPGFAAIAYKTGAAIIPMRIDGTHRALPRNTYVPCSYPVRALAGPPLLARSVPAQDRRDEYARLVDAAARAIAESPAPEPAAGDY